MFRKMRRFNQQISDFETPIVGAFIAMVYGIFVLVLAGVGTAVFAIRNRKEAVKNGDI